MSDARDALRETLENSTGFVGQVLRAKREKDERAKESAGKAAKIKETTAQLATTSRTLQNMEVSFIQISKNVQKIAKFFDAMVVTQDETNEALKAAARDKQRQQAATSSQSKQKTLSTSIGKDSPDDKQQSSLFSLLGDLLDGIGRNSKKTNERRRRRQQARRRKGKLPTKTPPPPPKPTAPTPSKPTEPAKPTKPAEPAKPTKPAEPAKPSGKPPAPKPKPTLSKSALKSVVLKKVAGKLASLGLKSIPIVGVAAGLGFAIAKLVQGDWVGAGLNAAGGLAGPISSIPETIYSTAREVYYEQYGVWPETDPAEDKANRWKSVYEAVKESFEESMSKMAKVVPPTPPAEDYGMASTDMMGTPLGGAALPEPAKPKPAATPAPPPPPPPAPMPAPAAGAPQKPATAAAKPAAAATPAPASSGGPEPLQKKISAAEGKKAMLEEMDKQKITDPVKRAAIMAQAAVETGGFTALSENLAYSAEGMKKTFGRLRDTPIEVLKEAISRGVAGIGSLVYGGDPSSPSYNFGVKQLGNVQPGDGFRYRGRGFFQLTGRTNYTKAGVADTPQKLLEIGPAAETAVSFAQRFKGDFSDVSAFTRFVNGGQIHVKERGEYFEKFLQDPQITKVGAAAGITINDASTTVAAAKQNKAKEAAGGTTVVVVAGADTKKAPQAAPRTQQSIPAIT